MKNQSGFVWLPLIIIGVVVALVVGTGAAAVFGEAPTCPDQGVFSRSESEIGDAISNGGTTVSNSEATAIASTLLDGQVNDPRVCFTPGEGHLSGSIDLGSVQPTFYISAGVDLSSSVPQVQGLKIQLGSLPDVPFISAMLNDKLNDLITHNLSRYQLQRTYTAEFSDGSVTIR